MPQPHGVAQLVGGGGLPGRLRRRKAFSTLSRVLNGHAAISPEMAIRLEKAGWSNTEFWLRRQTTYDLAQARKREHRIDVARYEPRPAVSG